VPAVLAARGTLGVAGLALMGDPTGVVAAGLGADQLARGLDWAWAVRTRIKDQGEAQLVLDPVGELTPVFVEDLTEVARDRRSVVVILDVWERIGPGVEEWVRDVVAGERYGELPLNVIVVMAGQSALTPGVWGEMAREVVQVSLEPFTEAEAGELLARHGVVEESVVATILRLTGGLPVLVDMLARARPTDPGQVGDPAETAVERFLAGQSDPARREAILACALPTEIDEDLYRAVLTDGRPEEDCGWLGNLPFVTADGGRYRYHQLVREQMLRLHRTRSPRRWRDLHTRLADHHAREREHLEVTLTDDGRRWGDDRWVAHHIAEVHHLLCADPHTALPVALAGSVWACARGPGTLRAWAAMLQQAGVENDHREALKWAERLISGSEEPERLVTVLGHLIAAVDLPSEVRVWAHLFRGWEHSRARDRVVASLDFDRAVELDPDNVWALASRGRTHRERGDHAAALADFGRAIELDPEYAWALAERGRTHHALGDHAAALVDFGRAIELDPEYAWALAERGRTHRALGDHAAALVDFGRAIELDPEYAWALAERGRTHHALGDHAAALVDFGRAIELDPEYAWALAERGRTHHALGDHAAALVDFGRAIELDPEYAWALASRGRTHRELGDHAAALVDFGRAIELDPEYAWALASRGRTHRELGDHAAALADYTRAVELNPKDGRWCHEVAVTYRVMGREQEARWWWEQALGKLAASVRAAGKDEAWWRSGVMLVYCARSEWQKSSAELRILQSLADGPAVLRRRLPDLDALPFEPGSSERLLVEFRESVRAVVEEHFPER
ncbi:tetratricopeptide repeat protein, partial [Streptomyces alkaliphilus]